MIGHSVLVACGMSYYRAGTTVLDAPQIAPQQPVAIDLCCGDGGFTDGLLAAGFYVIAVDIQRYPGLRAQQLLLCDVRTVPSSYFAPWMPRVVFAGPPCDEYSRHGQPWTRKRNPPKPDNSIVEHCFRIAVQLDIPIILENVRAAQAFIGRARTHYGPHYLWGDVPALLPHISFYSKHKKEYYSGRQKHIRARIPFELAYALACCFKGV